MSNPGLHWRSGAITRCWPSPPAPATCCWPGSGRAAPTPLGAPLTSCVKLWDGCATAGPRDNSRCGPTAASTPTPSSRSAASWMSVSPSPFGSTPACGTSSRPYPSRTGRRSPCILTLVMEPGAADRHPLGHDRPSSSEVRRAPYMQSPNSCLGQSSPYRARTGQHSRRRYRWKENRDT